jgi:hypothetical protein
MKEENGTRANKKDESEDGGMTFRASSAVLLNDLLSVSH